MRPVNVLIEGTGESWELNWDKTTNFTQTTCLVRIQASDLDMMGHYQPSAGILKWLQKRQIQGWQDLQMACEQQRSNDFLWASETPHKSPGATLHEVTGPSHPKWKFSPISCDMQCNVLWKKSLNRTFHHISWDNRIKFLKYNYVLVCSFLSSMRRLFLPSEAVCTMTSERREKELWLCQPQLHKYIY